MPGPELKEVTVHLVNGRHVCVPSPTTVRPGDRVHWTVGSLPIFFKKSPFVEGTGPLDPGTTSTVKKGIKGTFKGEVRVGGRTSPVSGDIIVIDP